MPRSLPAPIIQAMTAQTTDLLLLALVTVTHPNIAPIRIVNNIQDVTSRGKVFTAAPFSVSIPPDGVDDVPAVVVTVLHLGADVVTPCRQVAGSPQRAKLTLELIDYADPDTVITDLDWGEMDVLSAQLDESSLTITASLEAFFTVAFPGLAKTPANSPGLF